MKLDSKQKKHLLAAISEGLETDEINARAAKFKPAYKVSRQQVDHYRKTRGVQLETIKENSESDALRTGFALKEERVRALNLLAGNMFDELTSGRLWVQDVKSVGSGDAQMIVDFEEFNGAEVQAFRGTLDDIAKEVGDRRQKLDVKVDPREALAKLLGVRVEELPSDIAPDA